MIGKLLALVLALLLTACATPPASILSANTPTTTPIIIPTAHRTAPVEGIATMPPSTTPTPRKALVTATNFLTVRKKAGIKGKVVNYLPYGTSVTLIGDCDPDGWIEIEVVMNFEPVTGWVNADYLNYGGVCK